MFHVERLHSNTETETFEMSEYNGKRRGSSWVSGDAYLDDFINHMTLSAHTQNTQKLYPSQAINRNIQILSLKLSNPESGGSVLPAVTALTAALHMNRLSFALSFHFSYSHPPTKRAVTTDLCRAFDCSNSRS